MPKVNRPTKPVPPVNVTTERAGFCEDFVAPQVLLEEFKEALWDNIEFSSEFDWESYDPMQLLANYDQEELAQQNALDAEREREKHRQRMIEGTKKARE
jgi:hypothetical protein